VSYLCPLLLWMLLYVESSVVSFVEETHHHHYSSYYSDTIKSGIQKRHKNPVKSTLSTTASNPPSRNQPTTCYTNVIINYPVSLPKFPKPHRPIAPIGQPKNVPNFVNWSLKSTKTCGKFLKRWVDQFENVSLTIWGNSKHPRIFDRYDELWKRHGMKIHSNTLGRYFVISVERGGNWCIVIRVIVIII